MSFHRIAFKASSAPAAQQALADLTAMHGQTDIEQAEVVVALGGDGFMPVSYTHLHDVKLGPLGAQRGGSVPVAQVADCLLYTSRCV